ncbi:hypothetical protein IAT38_000857 [Cryptococcus sp. DSM 104549]
MPASPPAPPSPDSVANDRAQKRQKTSLQYICSPPSTSNNTTPPPMPPKTSSAPPKTLTSLPRDLLALVALYLVVDEHGDAGHPAALIPFFLTSRHVYQAISFDNNPQLYNTLFRYTFDHAALTRRFEWMVKHLPYNGRPVFNLFLDPRSWAVDYRTRWDMSGRMRQVAKKCKVDIPGVCDKDKFVEDMWNVWFLITENDGKNMKFLIDQCQLRQTLTAYYRDSLLPESLQPGYPSESGDKALVTWCCLFAGMDTVGEDSPEEVDEKIFMLRPYVFACAKYDVTYAPWNIGTLPLCKPGCTDHEPDASVRSKALTYKRFGYTWKRAPPHFILGAYLLFLRLLERQPDRVGLRNGSSFSQSPFEAGLPGLFSTYKSMSSELHDREWQRNTMCQDPHTSAGLPALCFRGAIQGFWRGKFLFYDFGLYREILGGNMRGVYTGMFAEQAAEMELRETLVKVKKEEVGGDGPLLHAGFKDMEDMDAEIKYVEAGYGHEIVEDDEEVEEGWTKEILITGRCRTSWGWAKVRGRVRAWDGLVTLCLAYGREPSARWLWRGYLHTGGHLVGRWRDTFTPENMRGYEGGFGLLRAGDPLYPEHYPQRMEDSLGVNQPVGAIAPINQAGLPPAPPQPTPPAQSPAPAHAPAPEQGGNVGQHGNLVSVPVPNGAVSVGSATPPVGAGAGAGGSAAGTPAAASGP